MYVCMYVCKYVGTIVRTAVQSRAAIGREEAATAGNSFFLSHLACISLIFDCWGYDLTIRGSRENA